MINHFVINDLAKGNVKAKIGQSWYLVDLPGYGYAKVSQKQRKSWTSMIEDYILKRTNLGNLFVLIDSRHEPQKIDLEFVDQLGEWQVPFAIVFTKADKNKPGATVNNVQKFIETLKNTWSDLPPYFVTSATRGDGREELLSFIHGLNKEFTALQGK